MTSKARTNAVKKGLTAQQERALLALLSTTSQEAAARQCGLASRSLQRYLADPVFQAEYRQRRRELVVYHT
jgi:hypothetical protein